MATSGRKSNKPGETGEMKRMGRNSLCRMMAKNGSWRVFLRLFYKNMDKSKILPEMPRKIAQNHGAVYEFHCAG